MAYNPNVYQTTNAGNDDIHIIDYEGYNPDWSQMPGYGYNEYLYDYFNFVTQQTDYNNAWSAQQAQKQMNFQDQQRRLAEQFNAGEAAKNRDWQKMMSDTAHQREMADYKAAGLNPILAVTGGQGAPVGSGASASVSAPSGAKGDTDTSANMAIASMLNGFLNAQTQLEASRVSAEANMAVADKYTAMEKILEQMKESYKTFEHENYPDSWFGVAEALIKAFGKDNPATTAKGVMQGAWNWLKDHTHSEQEIAVDIDKLLEAKANGYGSKEWNSIVADIKERGLLGDIIYKLSHDYIGQPVASLVQALRKAAR